MPRPRKRQRNQTKSSDAINAGHGGANAHNIASETAGRSQEIRRLVADHDVWLETWKPVFKDSGSFIRQAGAERIESIYAQFGPAEKKKPGHREEVYVATRGIAGECTALEMECLGTYDNAAWANDHIIEYFAKNHQDMLPGYYEGRDTDEDDDLFVKGKQPKDHQTCWDFNKDSCLTLLCDMESEGLLQLKVQKQYIRKKPPGPSAPGLGAVSDVSESEDESEEESEDESEDEKDH